jgi:hypothetical protein
MHVPRLRAALERLHPDEVALFGGFEVGAALVGVTSLLHRIDALERGEGAERALVLDTLAKRGLDRRERARLRRLLELAKRASTPFPASVDPGATRKQAALVALSRWFDDWTTTARACVIRKDWLIRMGLIQRRRARATAR